MKLSKPRRLTSFLGSAFLSLALSGPLSADPVQDSCMFLNVLGQNDASAVDAMIDGVATRWTPENRETATQQISVLASGNSFAGGNLYVVSKLGDDLEDHLIILRLKTGEVSGVLLRYEWSPDGLTLVNLDIKRRIGELLPTRILGIREAVQCS